MKNFESIELQLVLQRYCGVDYQHNEWVQGKLSNEEGMFFSKLDINYMISHIL